MTAATIEAARVAEVERLALIGRAPEADLEAIARLAARVAGVPLATINLIDAATQHQVAVEGFTAGDCSREDSMCNVTIGETAAVYLPDASQDPRFAGNPWVTGELGEVRFYNSSQLRTSDGLVVGTLCVFDTEVHELDEEQRRALDDLAAQISRWLELHTRHADLQSEYGALQASNEDLAAFAGRVAHDLRNPLTAITGFLTLADRRFAEEMSPRLQSIITTALDSAHRMAGMVDDMLAFASFGREPTLTEVDLARVAREVQIDTSSGGRSQIEVRALPTVSTDATLIRTLLANLVANALKFTREGVPGLVVVTGGATAQGWWLAVVDNGRGVPAEDREAIFEPFHRAGNSGDRPGSGIGLATCVRIAERLGGRLELSDTPGGGATFTLTVGA